MQMMIMAVKTLQPPSEKGRCRYVVPVIVCKQPVSVGEIRISAVGNECFPQNPYKNILYYICLNPHGPVLFEISACLMSSAAILSGKST